jgi:D-glycero-alpha-D-manno-heptose 1-phosphate guanylyltransferase
MTVAELPVIILAGGLGTRLRPVVNDLPKPMAPINGKPFLHYIFLYLQKQGVKEAVLSVGYKHEVIQAYFGNEYCGIKIRYSIEEEPLGTGGAIKKACSMCEGLVLVVNGDTFFDIDLGVLLQQHFDTVSEMTLALKPMKDFDRYGSVEMDEEERIVMFNEKKFLKEGLINGGVYVMHAWGVIQKIEAIKFSFEKEVLEGQIRNFKYSGKVFDNYFIDIGIPEDYTRAGEDFKNMFREA